MCAADITEYGPTHFPIDLFPLLSDNYRVPVSFYQYPMSLIS